MNLKMAVFVMPSSSGYTIRPVYQGQINNRLTARNIKASPHRFQDIGLLTDNGVDGWQGNEAAACSRNKGLGLSIH